MEGNPYLPHTLGVTIENYHFQSDNKEDATRRNDPFGEEILLFL